MQKSKALRLPSGRLLSDYRNFNAPESGWHEHTINTMFARFNSLKHHERGKLGALILHEVKMREGLAFDLSNWTLLGFTDLGDDSDIMSCFSGSVEKDNKSSPKLLSTKEKLATHIFQFFYKSSSPTLTSHVHIL